MLRSVEPGTTTSTVLGRIYVEDGKNIIRFIYERRRNRHEILLAETIVREGISSHRHRDQYSGELRRRYEESHHRH